MKALIVSRIGRKRRPRVLLRGVSLGLVLIASIGATPAAAQHYIISEPDFERARAVRAVRAEAAALSNEGRPYQCERLVLSVLDEAMELAPGLAMSLAMVAGRGFAKNGGHEQAAEWFERARDIALEDPFNRSQAFKASSAHGFQLRELGHWEEAADAFRYGDHEDAPADARFRLHENAAFAYEAGGFYDRANEALRQALEVARETNGITLEHEIRTWVFALNHPSAGEDQTLLHEQMRVYFDERYRDVPQRLNLIGRWASSVARHLGADEELETLVRDMLHEASRFEEELDYQTLLDHGVDEAIAQGAWNLGAVLEKQGRFEEAAMVLESALEAFPYARLNGWLEMVRDRAYMRMGVDPPKLEVRPGAEPHIPPEVRAAMHARRVAKAAADRAGSTPESSRQRSAPRVPASASQGSDSRIGFSAWPFALAGCAAAIAIALAVRRRSLVL